MISWAVLVIGAVAFAAALLDLFTQEEESECITLTNKKTTTEQNTVETKL